MKYFKLEIKKKKLLKKLEGAKIFISTFFFFQKFQRIFFVQPFLCFKRKDMNAKKERRRNEKNLSFITSKIYPILYFFK